MKSCRKVLVQDWTQHVLRHHTGQIAAQTAEQHLCPLVAAKDLRQNFRNFLHTCVLRPRSYKQKHLGLRILQQSPVMLQIPSGQLALLLQRFHAFTLSSFESRRMAQSIQAPRLQEPMVSSQLCGRGGAQNAKATAALGLRSIANSSS